MHSRRIWALGGLLAVIVGVCGVGCADDLAELYAGHKVKAEIGRAPSGKTIMLIDGRPQPLFWADLTPGGPEYVRAGFNTVFVELTFPKKIRPLDEAFKGWDKALVDAKRQGLYVIIYIHNKIHASAGKAPFSFDDQWRAYVQAIVKRYKPITNLIGWIYSDEPADVLTYPNEAFRESLKAEYKSIDALNRAWRADYAQFDDVVLEYKRDGRGRPEETMASPALPFGIGPKAFDSARFKLARVADAHAQFERAVREIDPDTPLWSGAHNLGWAATQIPADWGAFFDFYPGSSGNDYDTHHVWAMDIGRGPNVRPAMQMLLPERWDTPKWHLDARVVRGWMVESALHGAAGVTFWPWSMLGEDDHEQDRSSRVQRIDMCGMTIRTLAASGIFAMRPTNTIAVIYEPYAEGWGNVSQVYGVLRHPSEEPLTLMRQLKYGTRFGQVDYLTRGDVQQAELDDYGVILAQFAADIGADGMARLTEYVCNGGVLLADIGFDCIRAGKVVTGMSDEAKKLFGIKGLDVSQSAPGRFVATGEFSELLGGLQKGVDETDRICQMGLDVAPDTAKAALQGPGGQGLYVNAVGEGYALFCSGLGWSRWTVEDALFAKIHNALFARRAKVALQNEPDWTLEPVLSPGYEVARFGNGYALQNRTNEHVTLRVRVDGEQHEHALAPRSVLLIREGRMIPLGTGIWPAERGARKQ